MVVENEKQQVQFDIYVNVERFDYKASMARFIIDAVTQFDGVESVEQTREIELRDQVRFDLTVELQRPAEQSARSISESLLDYVIGVEHVTECRELGWRRLKSPLL